MGPGSSRKEIENGLSVIPKDEVRGICFSTETRERVFFSQPKTTWGFPTGKIPLPRMTQQKNRAFGPQKTCPVSLSLTTICPRQSSRVSHRVFGQGRPRRMSRVSLSALKVSRGCFPQSLV